MILLWALKASALFLGYFALRMLFRQARARRLLGALCFCLASLLPVAEVFSPVQVSLHVTQAPVEPPPSSVPILFWIWLGGLASAFVHLGLGSLAVRRLYRLSRPLSIDGRSQLRIAETSTLATAITWGWPRAVVLLPSDATQWSESQLQAVVLHELAHVRRGDILFHNLATLVRAALWFNPLAWIAAAKFREDYEASADEAVLEAGVRPTDYASVLLSMAGGYRGSAALAAVRQTHLHSRIERILQPRTQSRGGGLCAVILAGLFFCLAPAQLNELHSKEWLEGFELARHHISKFGSGPSENSTPLSAIERRNIERALSARKGSK